MANIVKHRFSSAKADGGDATQVQPSHWNDGHTLTGGAAGDVLTRDPTDASFGAIWTPFGTWQAVPFSAANFSAASGAAWAVSAGNVVVNRYTVLGKTLVWAIHIQGSTLSGPATSQLVLTMPNNQFVRPDMGAPTAQFSAGATNLVGFLYGGSTNYVVVQPHPYGAIPAGSVTLVFTATLEIL